ncbi:Heat-inducible transcription repressor HrcA [Aedoeadaptatus ivorii]|uniref:Heat-inducible transcription repressor HrcA n=1 Tax=Aedoeadaptatus ivorii TaxID=54006 RepID=A0A448V0V2_9FIRM|nr:heat-inducible transcriptional repressor HrcA [Peptoniphilus ivorii]VEJ35217.1 Heat-inducible transcription repressor HrcA [Peptoniphilus ivorii]
MDQRKTDILNIIIESYIGSPVPVGSGTISKESDLKISSATIRNEMSDLEEMGFLTKPHTSAGRIPSENAYRFYVDEWISEIGHSDALVGLFREAMPPSLLGTEEFYESAIGALADHTKSIAFMLMPKRGDRTIKYMDLIPVSEHLVMLLVVGDRGVVVKRLLPVEFPADEEELRYIREVLSRAFVGISFTEFDGVKFVLSGGLIRYEDFVLRVTEVLSRVASAVEEVEVITGGISNLFRYEEFRDSFKIRSLLEYLGEKRNLLRLAANMPDTPRIQFIIGSENSDEIMREYSVSGQSYPINDSDFAKVGLIGPLRMNYKKSAEALGAFTQALSERLWKER